MGIDHNPSHLEIAMMEGIVDQVGEIDGVHEVDRVVLYSCESKCRFITPTVALDS